MISDRVAWLAGEALAFAAFTGVRHRQSGSWQWPAWCALRSRSSRATWPSGETTISLAARLRPAESGLRRLLELEQAAQGQVTLGLIVDQLGVFLVGVITLPLRANAAAWRWNPASRRALHHEYGRRITGRRHRACWPAPGRRREGFDGEADGFRRPPKTPIPPRWTGCR